MYMVFTIVGIFGGVAYWFGAAIGLCGISGCSGGGFGVSYHPQGVLNTLAISGFIASFAGFVASIHLRSWRWLLIALGLLIGMPVAGALLIGTDFSGYPTRYPRLAD